NWVLRTRKLILPDAPGLRRCVQMNVSRAITHSPEQAALAHLAHQDILNCTLDHLTQLLRLAGTAAVRLTALAVGQDDRDVVLVDHVASTDVALERHRNRAAVRQRDVRLRQTTLTEDRQLRRASDAARRV